MSSRVTIETDVKPDIEADVNLDIEADVKPDIEADVNLDIEADVKILLLWEEYGEN